MDRFEKIATLDDEAQAEALDAMKNKPSPSSPHE